MRSLALEVTICVLLIVLSLCIVISTQRVFNAMMDEPIHIAAAYDFLTTGDYTLDIEHPPLVRIVTAIPLVLHGIRPPTARYWVDRGNQILNQDGHYLDNLQLARCAVLVFPVLMLVAVWLWTRRLFSPAHAIWAVFLLAILPPVLGHSGVVGTDVAGAAMLPLALAVLDVYLENPSWRNAGFLGIAVGLGLSAKFSFLVFFPPCAALLIGASLWRRRATLRQNLPRPANVAAVLGIAFFVVWAAYGFQVGTMASAHPRASELIFLGLRGPATLLQPIANNVPVPAPLFADGILEVKLHNERGHISRFDGEKRRFGVWYYFPTILFLKTPLAFLALALFGAAAAIRSRPEIALLPLGVLLPAMSSTINIGVRHILPIYPLLAILAAHGAVTMWRARSAIGKAAVIALAGWNVASTVSAWPDNIAWFNEAAGKHPENIVVDSNIDWGQDVLRLVDYCRAHRIDSLGTSLFVSCDLDRMALPPHRDVTLDTRGWIAVSETFYWGFWPGKSDYHYLDPYYRGHVGKSIRMFYVPPSVRELHR